MIGVGASSSCDENQRASTAEAIDGMPPLRTASMRAFHISAVPIFAAVLASTSRSIRCGAWMPSHMPTMPPIDKPQKCARGDRELVEQAKRIAGDLLDRIGTRRDR